MSLIAFDHSLLQVRCVESGVLWALSRAAFDGLTSSEAALTIQRVYRGWASRRRVEAFWQWWKATVEGDAAARWLHSCSTRWTVATTARWC